METNYIPHTHQSAQPHKANTPHNSPNSVTPERSEAFKSMLFSPAPTTPVIPTQAPPPALNALNFQAHAPLPEHQDLTVDTHALSAQLDSIINQDTLLNMGLELTPADLSALQDDIAQLIKDADFATLTTSGAPIIVTLTPDTPPPADDTIPGLDSVLSIQNTADKFTQLLRNASRQHSQRHTAHAPIHGAPTATAHGTAHIPGTHTPPTQPSADTITAQLHPQPQSSNLANAAPLTDSPPPASDTPASFHSTLTASAAPLPTAHNTAQAALAGQTAAHHAGDPHPATRMVAAHFGKLSSTHGSQTITLELDPPELGRVEIKMQISKDKTVTAKVIAEKPEAYLLLQRDSQALERAMHDSGLETGEDALEFSLADDNHGFNQDGHHDGSRNPTNGPDDTHTDTDSEIIHTSLTWIVNPETGHTQYSILA